LENTLYLDLEYGRVVIKMHPELAPKHVARIKQLVRQGFYDGLVWHRVIDGFMAQTGDPKGDGTGGSGQTIPAEFNAGRHIRGAVSMARAANINSADSQFFIVLADSPHLDGQYTYWGEVVSGMEFVDRIRKGDPDSNGMVPYPDRIVRMQVAADAEKAHDVWPRPEAGSKPEAKQGTTQEAKKE
jgi:peptidylprolyl isomerase